jgi:hypothetical protein
VRHVPDFAAVLFLLVIAFSSINQWLNSVAILDGLIVFLTIATIILLLVNKDPYLIPVLGLRVNRVLWYIQFTIMLGTGATSVLNLLHHFH